MAEAERRSLALAMAAALKHRGPDADGSWSDTSVSLTHRRLSIVDLSPLGAQPMISESGRFVIVFNGEIYNFLELRAELSALGHAFKGGSDTEVMLASIEEWGVESSLRRFVGMFAFAVWDRSERTLTLARDRMGEKPLYYGWCREGFLFASELKAIRAVPLFEPKVSKDALAEYLRFNYVPCPLSIYEGVYKLFPGTLLQLKDAELRRRQEHFSPWPDNDGAKLRPQRYWSAAEFAGRPQALLSDADAVSGLDALLRDAVKRQMIADVPLGAFLSGGIDSSVLVTLMQRQSGRPVKTFSIGFHEEEFNEARYAKDVAAHLGTEHTELYLTPSETLSLIPSLPEMYDEPFGDSSQIPTHLVSRLARTGVTVSLSGDGGDELFCGYLRYPWGAKLWRSIRFMPLLLRRVFGSLARTVPIRHWDVLLKPIVPGVHFPGYKVHRLAEILSAQSLPSLYHGMLTHWSEELVPGAEGGKSIFDRPLSWPEAASDLRRMMFFDQVSYLPDDILVKVDRASMAISLETRAPYLDHRVVEYAWSLPDSMKLRNSKTKWILREVLKRYMPERLFERPKMGFAVPVDRWLRGPLREWAEELLRPERLEDGGYLRSEAVRRRWSEHLGGKDWSYQLWIVLMLQAWRERAGV